MSLKGSRDNFIGPNLGLVKKNLKKPMAIHKPFVAFQNDDCLDYVCKKTNLYAKHVNRRKFVIKGGLNGREGWFDFCLDELRWFLSILVNTGLKELPHI